MSSLDNGTIRVGVDLSEGGVITYLARSDATVSVINDFDLGRQVQQSYYAGPQPYGTSHPSFPNFPWNPIGAGDVYGHASRVVTASNDGATIYVRSVPLQWALDNVPCECTFEHWITLEGRAAHVRNRLTTNRPDRTLYPGFGQELPAVYTTGRYYRVFTYRGAEPFTGAALSEVSVIGNPTEVDASEHWTALVDAAGFGLGVFNPTVTRTLATFFGVPCACGPKDNPTGYLSPTALAIIDPVSSFEYRYDLVLGTVSQIREHAVRNRPPDTRPNWRFVSDRQGFAYVNAVDRSYPPDGALHVVLGQEDPQLWSPQQTWPAAAMPLLYVHAALRGSQGDAQVFWSSQDGGYSEERSLHFGMIPDGRFRTYAVELASSARYRGTITSLRLDPVPGGDPTAAIDIAWIRSRTVTHRRVASLRISRGVASGRVSVPDGFSACRPGPVRLERKSAGSWRLATRADASPAGIYRARVPRLGTYRAVALRAMAGNEICAKAVSPVRRS